MRISKKWLMAMAVLIIVEVTIVPCVAAVVTHQWYWLLFILPMFICIVLAVLDADKGH